MIRLNLSTDFALRLLIYLASHPGEQPATRTVAEFYEISADHLSKVVQQLAYRGMVRAGRGRGGGLRLAMSPEMITVGDVVEWFEGPVALLECVSTPAVCVIQPGCWLRRVLDRAGRRLVLDLKGVTLADLVLPGADALVQLPTGRAGSEPDFPEPGDPAADR